MHETLIKRLEALTGPDREVDTEIWLTVTPGATRRTTHVDHWNKPYDIDETRDGIGKLIIVPNYTGSIDAARSICKDAMVVQASEIGADGLPMVRLVTDTSTSPVIDYIGIASTIELAWCIAALRARGMK